jgi:hypothetical protein
MIFTKIDQNQNNLKACAFSLQKRGISRAFWLKYDQNYGLRLFMASPAFRNFINDNHIKKINKALEKESFNLLEIFFFNEKRLKPKFESQLTSNPG